MDYTMGLLLIVAPALLGFYRGGAESWVPIILGAGVLLYSLFTRYELGLIKAIPMSTHLTLDFVGGVVLAVSPWLFGFADLIWAPHLILGLLEIGAALMTQLHPAWETAPTTTHPS
jgi:hypothetical protein